MRGSIVEVLAWRGRVEFLLLSEPMAREMHWVNGQAVARTYRWVPMRLLRVLRPVADQRSMPID